MLENLNIRDIKRGDIYWESDDGKDACFIALTDAHREGQGTAVDSVDILTGQPCHHYQHKRAGGYGLRLYTTPQYTRPDWHQLMFALSVLAREWAGAESMRAAAAEQHAVERVAGISGALGGAELKAKLLAKENAKLRAVIDKVADQCNYRDVPKFGVTLAMQIKHIIETEGRPWQA